MTLKPKQKKAPSKCAKAPLRARILRLVMVFVLVVLSVFVISRIAAPYVVSIALVRRSIEKSIGRWSGQEVQIKGTPILEFWPQPKITLPNVTLSDPDSAGSVVLAKIDRLSATFGLWDAAMGRPVFNNFVLTRPTIHLHRDKQGRMDWGNGGPLTEAIVKVQESPSGGQSLAPEIDGKIGSISVENGKLDIADDALGHKIVVEGVFSQISWPQMSASLKGSANMLIGGVATQLDFSSSQPLLLMGGHQGQANLAWTAPSIKGSFSGRTSLMPARFASGRLNMTLSDAAGFLKWTGAELPGMEALHTASVQATITAGEDRLRLEDLSLTANDTSATGLVDITQAKSGKPKVSGTLAFSQMDIPTFLAAFSLSTPDTSAVNGKTGLLNWLEFDLTLSARRASLAQFTLTDVGASVLATDGSMVFDIADSTLAGGTMTSHLEGRNGGFEDGAHLDLSITDADLSDLESKLGLNGPLPLGPGSLSISASTRRPIWQTMPNDIVGTLKLTAGPGHITGVNLGGIQSLAENRAFFKLQDAGKGDLPFDRLSVSAELAKGAIDIKQGTLTGSTLTSSFTGIIPYVFKGLALSTELHPMGLSGLGTQDPMRFFIAGSWPDLILSPIPTDKAKAPNSP